MYIHQYILIERKDGFELGHKTEAFYEKQDS